MEIFFSDTSLLKSLFSISLSMFPILHMNFSFLLCFHSVWTVSWWRTNWIRYRPIRTYGYVVENLFVLNDYKLKAIEFWFLKSTTQKHTQTHTHIHTQICTHKHAHPHTQTCTPTHVHIHRHTRTHTHTDTYTHTHTHMHTQTHTHTYTIKHTHTHTHTRTQTHTYTNRHTHTHTHKLVWIAK